MAWAQYVHPEFGCFCPTPRLRRELRIAFASILFGTISGAAGVIALSAGHRNANPPTVASVVTSKTPITAPLLNGDEMSAAAQGYNRLEGGVKTTDGLRAKNEVDKASAPDKSDAPMTACRDDASDMSGPCLAGKPRRARVGAATDGPDVARLPLGRTAATPAGITARLPMARPRNCKARHLATQPRRRRLAPRMARKTGHSPAARFRRNRRRQRAVKVVIAMNRGTIIPGVTTALIVASTPTIMLVRDLAAYLRAMSHPRAADFGTGRGEPTFTLLFLPHHLITRLHQVRRHTCLWLTSPRGSSRVRRPTSKKFLMLQQTRIVKGTTARLSNYYGR